MVRRTMSPRLVAVALFLVSLSLIAFASKQFVMPRPNPAKTYPAHEAHTDEHVTLAADPYDTQNKENSVFSVNYLQHGYMPVHLIITNDGQQAISLLDMKVQLVTKDRTKISPATNDDLFRRLGNVKRPGPSANPIPFPRTRAKGAIPKEAYDELDQSQFQAKAVEPENTQSGFLFFDVSEMDAPLAGAHLYVTGMKDGNGHELFYFEIPLEKYLSAPPPSAGASTPIK